MGAEPRRVESTTLRGGIVVMNAGGRADVSPKAT